METRTAHAVLTRGRLQETFAERCMACASAIFAGAGAPALVKCSVIQVQLATFSPPSRETREALCTVGQ